MNASMVPFDHELFPAVIVDAMKHLTPAIEQSSGRHTEESILQALMEIRLLLWIAYDEEEMLGALVTSMETYPGGKMLNLLFCGGERIEEWHEPMLDVLEDHARVNGCMGMELVGRKGWKKFLDHHGWESEIVLVQKLFKAEEKKHAA